MLNLQHSAAHKSQLITCWPLKQTKRRRAVNCRVHGSTQPNRYEQPCLHPKETIFSRIPIIHTQNGPFFKRSAGTPGSLVIPRCPCCMMETEAQIVHIRMTGKQSGIHRVSLKAQCSAWRATSMAGGLSEAQGHLTTTQALLAESWAHVCSHWIRGDATQSCGFQQQCTWR